MTVKDAKDLQRISDRLGVMFTEVSGIESSMRRNGFSPTDRFEKVQRARVAMWAAQTLLRDVTAPLRRRRGR
jgi:hypothetical protein